MTIENLSHKFIWNMTEFMNLKPHIYDHVLGK